MENTSYIALSRQNALWRQLDVIAGNMANANTPGYKSEQMMFREYLMDTRSSDRATGKKLSYVQDIGLLRDTREGAFTKTDNPLDLALHNDGFFQVETEAGMRYTRNGHFRLDEGGMLVNSQGAAVMDTGDNPIILAPNETRITVTPDGSVSTENGIVAKIKVVRFANDQDMRKIGDSLYETTQDPDTIARPSIVQGMMEESNVQPVVEITKMTEVLRQYQALQNILEKEHERQMKAMEVFVSRN
ncbi:flagellar basal-body rod protein FlgF [Magnetospirillum gryphiswaldense]|uniref:Flagellar basal-body rod protein FlgF n=2 Tax=Magnetospirillum gryphiswaldense TaxID=55518 RepID=V6F5Y3_MAGGM|nr:flagellar basal-body rod protein FlgF [Magnetospirillum gryphiswaldense]AVM75162.1 Flagellar basal-body rod protein FlgG [Magnetospirillum gryphiswaldense MSR-1]AVM79065.1 Flagellar basal-body rod protein FlgG [Magnetospirillum gryphiswaldense]CDL00930.1 putative flagellar protein [Magnetospirillum gryphiswaldense MSR-1 v2]